MVNSRRFYWLAQLGGWAGYFGLVMLSNYSRDPKILTGLYILNWVLVILTGILATHVQRFVFIKLGWLNMRLPALIPRLLISSTIFALAIWGIDFITDYYTGFLEELKFEFSVPRMIFGIIGVLILVLSWNAIYFTFHFFQKSRKQEISNLELAASNKESELKNLRSQLNPHFLFNSLNSIRALVDIDPIKAKKSITTLSNLLRQSLVLGKENLVSLENELNVAKSYLDLERVRFEERLNVEWEIDSELADFQVPPFSLQMMVENSIKHGISNLKEGGIVKISAYSNEDRVCIKVVNTGNLSKVMDLGVGIENIQKRLELQYGDNASFALRELPDNFVEALMCFKNERV
ncbi:histidine kinase [Crocinitomicaceae bacterium]|nr:histidine kinase [Crocinitomicaceae bacterium]